MEKNQIDSIVVDTGIIYALADRGDAWHARSVRFLNKYQGTLIVPCSVIPEACYLLDTYLSQSAETSFVQSLFDRELLVDHFEQNDLARCSELIRKYADLNLGFVDASIVAVCERRGILSILTTDRKHFAIVRSKKGQAFQLLP